MIENRYLIFTSILLSFILIPNVKASQYKIGGYDFVYEETTCNNKGVCTLMIKSFPTVYDMLGRQVSMSDAIDVTTDSFGGIGASIGGQYITRLEPEVMVCTSPIACQNLSLRTGAISINALTGVNWNAKVHTTKMKDSWKFAYNVTKTPSRIKAMILRINGTNPILSYDFSDLENTGFVVKYAKDYIYVETPINTAWLDPQIIANGGNVTDDTHLANDSTRRLSEFGADDDLNIAVFPANKEMPILRMGGLNFTPAGATITNATLWVYLAAEALDAGESLAIRAFEVYQPSAFTVGGAAWTEGGNTATASCVGAASNATGTEISWSTQPNTTTQMNTTPQYTFTTADSGGGARWHFWNVTQAVARAYGAGYKNITFMLNATAATGTPDTTDCGWYASSEDGTATLRPMLNITYTLPLDNSSCTYSGSGNWNVDCGSLCRMTSAFDVAGNITIRGSGSFTTLVNIGYKNRLTIIGNSSTAKCKTTCVGGCFKKR